MNVFVNRKLPKFEYESPLIQDKDLILSLPTMYKQEMIYYAQIPLVQKINKYIYIYTNIYYTTSNIFQEKEITK
jgi:hypothetical protein